MNWQTNDIVQKTVASCFSCWGFHSQSLVHASRDQLLRFDTSSWVVIALDYFGPISGTSFLLCPRELGATLNERLLGEDLVREDELLQEEALLEALNVLLGNIIPTQYGKDVAYELGLPKVVRASTSEILGDAGIYFGYMLENQYPIVLLMKNRCVE